MAVRAEWSQTWRRSWLLFGALGVAGLSFLSVSATAGAIDNLGPVPPSCDAQPAVSNCLFQTRLGTFSLSPHVVHAGRTLTGTIAGDCKIGYDRPDDPCPINWSELPGRPVSGCGQFDHACARRIPASAATQQYTVIEVGITNGQGLGISKDYYAVIGKGRFELAGHVKDGRGKPSAGVPILITGPGVRERRHTDSTGGYNAVLKRGRYLVTPSLKGVKPVRSPGCLPVERSCRVTLIQDRTADFAVAARLVLGYEMPPRLQDANGDGLIDYPTDIDPKAFTVWIAVSEPGGKPCDTQATYSFVLDGRAVSAAPGPRPCVFAVQAPGQGSYSAEVTAKALDGTQAQGTRTVDVRDFLIVGLGDSVGSGEGNPDVPSTFGPADIETGQPTTVPARWEESRCDRSANSFEAQAARSIEEVADRKASVSFLHLACSGAGISVGVTSPYFGIAPGGASWPLSSQVSNMERLAGSRKVDAVLISTGANDIGFGDIVSFCALHSRCYGDTFKDNQTLWTVTKARLRTLPSLYARLATRLKAAGVPANRVYITQYYDPLRGSDGLLCNTVLGLMGAQDAAWAYNSVMRPLNVQVATAAKQWNWNLVRGAQQGFATHGYCASDSWIVGVTESFGRQGNEKGTMHPNVAGHHFISGLVLDALKPDLLPHGKPRPVGQAGATAVMGGGSSL